VRAVRIGDIEPISVVDGALDHLRAAVAAQPKYLEYAATDTDLDSIRDDPRFPT
jgi:hypothetical protein